MGEVRYRPRRRVSNRIAVAASGSLALGVLTSAHAVSVADNDTYQARLDTTIAYTLSDRVGSPSANKLANPNGNDGDGAFKRGDLTSNRVDASIEFDASLKDAAKSGVRVSANAWYDTVYNGSHAAIPQATYNAFSVPNDQFTATAQRMAGRDIQLFDAFVHSGVDIGDHNLSFRLGRHSLLWGESLFMATNGISNGQAPVNAIKGQSVPLTPAKELFLPVSQLSAAFSVNPELSLVGFYQFEYREDWISPPGTYFSTADLVFQGAERIIAAPGTFFYRGRDVRPPGASGQWGFGVKHNNPDAGVDLGAYYVRYSDKTPQIYATPSGGFDPSNGSIGQFQFVYPRNIEIFGASASTTVGDANVAGEVSYRHNMPLVSNTLVALPGVPADGNNHPLYAVGDTLHAQASTIWVVPKTPIWDTASLLAEVGGHYLVSVQKNPGARDTTTGRFALGVAMAFEPKYYQLFPAADVSFPIAFAYNLNSKKSPVDPAFNGGTGPHGGSIGLGVKVQYAVDWVAGLNWTHYLGADATNNYRDRDFVSLTVKYSF